MKLKLLLITIGLLFTAGHTQVLDVDYFNSLKAEKKASTPDFEWRQFGPGNSGYCEEFWIHPTDTNAFFMSPDLSNSYGTFDNGETWQTIKEIDGNGRGMRRVQTITFSRQNANLGYAANVRGFLFKTTDKGRSWNKILELDEGRHSEIAVDPSDDRNWYIGAGDFWNVKGYHRTKAKPEGNIDNFIAYGHIYRSTNKGNTWQKIIVDPTHVNNLSIGVIIVDPENSNRVIAATNFGLYRSLDKGLTWTLLPSNGLPHNLPRDLDFHIDRRDPNNPITTLYLVEQTHYNPNGNTINSSGGVYKSTNFGNSWRNITGNLGVKINSGSNSGNDSPNGVDNFTTFDKYYRAIAYWLGINKNTAKSTYNQLPNGNVLSVYNRLVVNPRNKNEIYIAFNAKHDFTFGPGDVWKTDNGGQSWYPCVRSGKYWNSNRDDNYWSSRNSPNTINTTFAHIEEETRASEEYSGCRFLEINNKGEVFISLGQQTLRSNNKGNSWEQIDDIETSPGSKKWIGRGDSNLPGRFILTETGKSGRKLLCSGEHGLWQTVSNDDYPDSDELTVAVEQIEGQNNPNGAHSISSVAVHPNDPNTIFTLQFRQKHRGYLRKSTDGGNTWNNISFPFDGNYAGTSESQQHIYQYDLLIRPDLPERMYFTVMENPVAEVNADFRIVTRDVDFGVKRSFDGGQTWTSSNSGLPEKPSVRRITFNPDKPWVMYAALNISRIGNRDGGLYVSTNSGQFWNQITTLPSAIKSVNNVFVDTHKNSNNQNDIFISCGRFTSNNPNEGGVWKSSDNGATWNKIFDMPYVWQTETSKADPNIITVNVPLQNNKGANVTVFNPGAYVTFDGGNTWEKISNNLGQPDLITDLKPDPEKRNTFWLALKGSAWAKGVYTGKSLSVDKNELIDDKEILALYPNPVADKVTIESEYIILGSHTKLEVYNLSGQLIKRYEKPKQLGNSKIEFNLEHLSTGTYILQISNNDKKYIKKLIKI